MKFDHKEKVVSLLVLLMLIGIIVTKVTIALAQPIPPGAESMNLKIAWDPPPASDVFNAVDTNGVKVPLLYRIWHTSLLTSTNSITNFVVIAETTNYQATITNLLVVKPHFFLLTVSNYFLESDPSDLLGVPAMKGQTPGLRFVIP